MNSSRTVSRAGVHLTDSSEDYTHITLAAGTHHPSMQSNNAIAQEEKTNSRPRRSTANYRPWTGGCPTAIPAQAKKRRHTTAPDNETIGMRGEKTLADGPQRSTSLQTLPSEAKRRRTARPHPELAEVQEVQELLKAPSTDLRVEDPAHSSSMSINTLTRHLSMPLLETTIGDIPTRVAGSMIKYWRTWKGGHETATQTTMNEADIPNESQGQMGGSSKAKIENVKAAHLSLISNQRMGTATAQPLVSNAPTLDEEQMDSSYIRCNTSDEIDEAYEEVVEDKQVYRQTNSASSTKGQESQAALEEQPPPPLTGHPAARQGPYRPNVLPRNPIQKHTSALVWDSRSQPSTCLVTLDNGADPNFISYETATRLGYSPLELHRNDYQLFSTLNGIENLATQYIWLDIEIPKLKIPRDACCLLVVQSSEIEIILGYYYLSEHEVFQRLVAKSSGHPSAYAIISKKPTQEQIRTILEQREERAKRALETEAKIEADANARRLNRGLGAISRQGTSHSNISSIAGPSSQGAVHGPTTMITAMNNSFEPAMGRDQRMQWQLTSGRHASRTEYFDGGSSADSSSFRDSLDSSPTNSGHISPATTFSSKSTADSTFELGPVRKPPRNFGDVFEGKGKRNA